ncbi:thiol-disulfide oxidoreductase LTO1 [Humulus lupulus]|uniref:thiol-disulfide oxidoreductase LTO1 n=1 Tax=Humulus lupulus TaxID=3486 RepID=UPI002B417246|nr:thiol-disulfide oxidoreductase LTO1 [Humulus lupulus]
MATMASFSTPSFSCRASLPHSNPCLTRLSFAMFQNKSSAFSWVRGRRTLLLPLRCSSPPTQDSEPEPDTTSSSSSSSSLSSSSSPRDLSYNLYAGLGAVGFVETTYLTYLKLTNSSVFCPIGGGSCSDILNSDYAQVFGVVPLPLIGMAAYGLVAVLGLQLTRKSLPFGLNQTDARLVLLTTITSMAAASGYFLYILSTKFAGSSCSYCLLSALLSFSLFFITLKDIGLPEIQKEVGLQLFVAGLVIVTLNSSYSKSRSGPSSMDDINLPYFPTEITSESSPFAVSLAKHLNSIGAKMYGAFWCSHCLEQKEMFGREAAKFLNYVECFPNGFKKGTLMEKTCAVVGIEGFPTWVINGKVLSGELEFSELAEASGFPFDKTSQSPVLVQ